AIAPQGKGALWRVLQATFGVLNSTYPNLTKECWLCYNINPPFYEALGSTAKSRRINGTNPALCLWKGGKENTPGISLAQVNGKGRCIG
ncbi:ENV2 protein, partial [Pardalotus punctatus]|nr:ENV2 protein [Pardalotus punctatus]